MKTIHWRKNPFKWTAFSYECIYAAFMYFYAVLAAEITLKYYKDIFMFN